VTGLLFLPQSDIDPALKLELDEDGLPIEGATGENSAAKPKAPRVKREKKEPGQYCTSTGPTGPM